ncbi:hypothetical protein DEO72_LG11g2722 [Vigna unguiculata]|uniref:Uncharacterized protein n=1 Tax=Vigna unguiculata TaxID=3917 RepID=A0A4D6NPA6_VIGUN|nr:hypothetical protein DEO72_LG11g2722 [Vigna unguiculata]
MQWRMGRHRCCEWCCRGNGKCWGGEWMALAGEGGERGTVSCSGGEVLWCWGWMAQVWAPVLK